MNLIIASTSTVYGGKYLNYLTPVLTRFFSGVDEIIFIPYARPSGMSHDAYTFLARKYFDSLGIHVKGIHEFADPNHAIRQAKGIFVGGGNTFLLSHQLYKLNLWNDLHVAIQNNIPYLGTSAGSNITGKTMQTTNDMPVVKIPSYKTLGIFPFNINPHYLDPEPDLLQHMGETRDTRLKEYLHFNQTPVVALREGSWVEAGDKHCILKGKFPARVYLSLDDIREIRSESDLCEIFR